ncbi:two component transcriptional regulator, sensor histidine kinase [Variovorax paradoxus B4]|uniref:histidine kinase n=1 Tax=Variovorax paradoxus B4 TaxID=1246301 RepID=T1XKY8_VARPD|nr:ATP-binding protein [Variovorax paradoxus]AGU52969.1 two component transcriptional regulator, sensor histidine kinase [Variovorax paradoxus B4]
MTLPRSLQGRLLSLVLGLVAGVWLVTAVMTWLDARHELDELLDSHLAQGAALLVAQQMQPPSEEERSIEAPVLHRYAPRVAFQVFHEGRLAMRSANAPSQPMIDSGRHFASGFSTAHIDGATWRVFAAHGSERDVQVYVGERMDSRSSILWAVLRSTLWPVFVALPLLALAVWWAVRRGTLPLRRLGRTLARREPQALSPVVLDDAPSEMTPMLDALNGLFRRIGELLESERRFTADAAHELRTPIAAIRAQAQVALAETDEGRRRHALEATLSGCDRATHLVEQLLTLSRLEAGAGAESKPVDLGALVRGVVAEAAPAAIGKQQNIEVDAADECLVRGDPMLFAVLVRNLVDNAIRYSPALAAIHIGVVRWQGHVRLRVEDSGPGMKEEDIARCGARFFRVLGSGESGSGLGWSIIRRVASAQQAVVRIERSGRLGGLAVDVEWAAA